MKKLVGICLLIQWIGFHSSTWSQVLNVESHNGELIGNWVGYYEDNTNTLSLTDMVAIHTDGGFQKNDKNVFAQPASQSTHWFSFSFQKSQKEPIWLNIFNQGLDYITVYHLNDDMELISENNSGAFTQIEDRKVHSYTHWFDINPAEQLTVNHVFIRINTGGMLEVPIFIGNYRQLEETDEGNRLYGIFFLGAVFIMFCYNLFLFLSTRDWVYFYYIGYIFFIGVSTTFANSFPFVTALVGHEFVYSYVCAWVTPSIIFVTLFFIRYLKLKENFYKAYRILIIIISICVLPGVLNLFIPVVYLASLFQLFLAISVLSIYVIGVVLWVKGSKRARFFVIAWSLNVCAIISYIAVTNGALPFELFFRNILYVGVLFELVVFSFALAERLNELKRNQRKLNMELSNTNRKLRENNASLDAFNYHVSHDLKTVLNNSNALARMILKYNEQGNPNKVNEIGDKLLKITKNGAETVSGFLSLGKVDNELKKESNVRVPIRTTLENLLKNHDLIEKIQVEINLDGLDVVWMNQKAFESIFLNFFTNSIKYNENRPVARIDFRQSQKYIFVSYSDNGIGIDLQKQGDNLFRPFERGDQLIEKEGTGVGLYLVKRIVEFYDGEIAVQSEPGKGATFQFSLAKVKGEKCD